MAATTESPTSVDARLAPVVLCCAWVIAALTCLIIGLGYVLPRDPGRVSNELASQFVQREMLYPEPTERAIFLTCLAALPVLAVIGAWLTRRLERQKVVFRPIVALGVLLAVTTLATNYETRRMLDVHEDTTLLWVGLAVAIACIAVSSRRGWLDLVPGRRARVAFAVLAVLAAFLAFSWRTLSVRSLVIAWRNFFHLDAVLYTTVQAEAGRLPLVDFPSQYGFFGTILAPWFRAVTLSVWSFTLTMNALQLVAFLAILVFAFRRFRNLSLAIGGCVAVFFFTGAWAPLRFEADPFFQVMPVRFVFPALSVLFVSEWLRAPTHRATVVISLFAGVALVWNIDSGVAVAGSWLGLLGFRTASDWLRRRDAGRSLATTAIAFGLIAAPVLLFAIWLRWAAHAPVDFASAFASQRLFYGVGYYMLPMSYLWEPWEVVVAVYVCGFVLGCFHAFGYLANDRAPIIHYLAFLGLGLFPYFQGRSHERVLMAVVWPAVLIAFLMADWAWSLSKERRLGRVVAAIVCVPTLALGALCALLIVRDIPGMTELARDHASGMSDAPGVLENIDFIRSHARGRKDIALLARFQAVYLAETGLASSVRGPGVAEIVTHPQANAIIGEIEERRPTMLFIGRPYLEPGWRNPFTSLLPFVSQHYRLAARTSREELRLYVLAEPQP